ncbi:uncharacterized protein [Lepeophtheirus salmonis]|uniref:uncharacterized protein isoform X1 n=1 Tax=Lepeophtheirus salmonis TaxID=72036 RepID=UPI001AE69F6E|nr:KH domain-containing, RNA-binding, signal transduction-associated protein 2-like [Lepeophtheirus salmonis]
MMASVPGNLLHPSLMPTLAGLIPLNQGSGALSVLHSLQQNRLLFQTPVVAAAAPGPSHHPPPQVPPEVTLGNGLFTSSGPIEIPSSSSNHHHHIMSMSPPARSLSSSSSPPVGVDSGILFSTEESTELIKELQKEKESLESISAENKNHTLKLIDQEIQRLQSGLKGGGSGLKDSIKYVDVYRERPIRLTVRVLVPVREHPKFNFVGKLLGPKGNSMKRLQEETMSKMAVLGRGSMRDKQKEEELRASSDPKYQHLNEELHVEITAFAPPAEAHARIAYALTEVRKYLIPDSNDEIRLEQMREIEILAANGGDSLTIAALAAAAASDPKRGQTTNTLHAAAAAGGLTLAAANLRPQPTAALLRSPGTPFVGNTGIRNPLTPTSSTFPPLVHKIVSTSSSCSSSSTSSISSVSSSSTTNNAVAPKNGPHGLIMGGDGGAEFLHLESACREDGLLTGPMGGDETNGIMINGLKAPGVFHDNRIKLRQNIAPY